MGSWSQLPHIVHLFRLPHGGELVGTKSAEQFYESPDPGGITFSPREIDIPHIFFVWVRAVRPSVRDYFIHYRNIISKVIFFNTEDFVKTVSPYVDVSEEGRG